MKYKATVRFSGFAPGEIIEIPEDNDLPESYFTNGFLVPLEKPKQKPEVKPAKTSAPTPKVTITKPAGVNITTNTTSTYGAKPDKLD